MYCKHYIFNVNVGQQAFSLYATHTYIMSHFIYKSDVIKLSADFKFIINPLNSFGDETCSQTDKQAR
jgi:hypothetical protein